MKGNDFSKRADTFIRTVINQRIYLVKHGLSKKPDTDQLKEAGFLLKHLDAYPIRSNRQMAGFWNKNAHRVMAIMPGKGSASYTSMINVFMQLTKEAKDIMLAGIVSPVQTIIVF